MAKYQINIQQVGDTTVIKTKELGIAYRMCDWLHDVPRNFDAKCNDGEFAIVVRPSISKEMLQNYVNEDLNPEAIEIIES